MDKPELAADVSKDPAAALKLLLQVIDDPKARARTRLDAIHALKKHLLWLKDLIQAPQTPPDVRKEIIDALRIYRRS
jgi:hypothetical protein